jgi:RNA polymerase sigma-70 factor (ECF subfamily)
MTARDDPPTGPGADAFEAHRRHLMGLAYRMLGSHAEAEDAVQEAWLRWHELEPGRVAHPRAFLSKTVTHLCLDRLKSAQHRREIYVGPWLPEPVLADEALLQPGPEQGGEFASDLSYAFMLALERLSPLERAAFLLHDVFDADFAEVAQALGRSEAACRQLASRARTRVREARPRYAVPPDEADRLTAAFLQAAQSGDAGALKSLLAEDVRFLSDGGGRVSAAGIPILGRERVVKVMTGIARKHPLPADVLVTLARVNGLPGCLVRAADGTPIQTIAVEFDDERRVTAVYVVRNPDKLRHLTGAAAGTAH